MQTQPLTEEERKKVHSSFLFTIPIFLLLMSIIIWFWVGSDSIVIKGILLIPLYKIVRSYVSRIRVYILNVRHPQKVVITTAIASKIRTSRGFKAKFECYDGKTRLVFPASLDFHKSLDVGDEVLIQYMPRTKKVLKTLKPESDKL